MIFFLLALIFLCDNVNGDALKKCPFLSTIGSPCSTTSPCATDAKSSDCRNAVLAWCKNQGDKDPACMVLSPKVNKCPFLPTVGSPCSMTSPCATNAKSSACRNVVVAWCKNQGNKDPGCIALSPKVTKKCPYLSTIGSPCSSASPCATDAKSSTCRNAVVAWCKTQGNKDSGCVTLSLSPNTDDTESAEDDTTGATGGTSPTGNGSTGGGAGDTGSAKDDTTGATGGTSPTGNDSTGGGAGDTGSAEDDTTGGTGVTSPTGNDSTGGTNGDGSPTAGVGSGDCPFKTFPNPCSTNSACVNQQSKECFNEIQAFCKQHPKDPGCYFVGHPPTTPIGGTGDGAATGSAAPYCPFDITSGQGSPCGYQSACIAIGYKSQNCRTEVVAFCRANPLDAGCAFVAPVPTPTNPIDATGSTGGSSKDSTGSTGSTGGSSEDPTGSTGNSGIDVYCPFITQSNSNPCRQSVCLVPKRQDNSECMHVIHKFCQNNPNDQGCAYVGPLKPIDNTGDGLVTGAATAGETGGSTGIGSSTGLSSPGPTGIDSSTGTNNDGAYIFVNFCYFFKSNFSSFILF